MNSHENLPDQMRILKIPISIINLRNAAELVVAWAKESSTARTIFVREAASLMTAVKEPFLKQLHEKADLVVPDGTPLVWLGKARGLGSEIGRVAGADLVDTICSLSVEAGVSHYFYGGKPGVAAEVARRLQEKYPGLEVAGHFSPPMRDIGPDFEFDEQVRREIELIRETQAAVIWVGLSSPKQEYWMSKASLALGQGIFLGVGAAFDFHAGVVQRAPAWMRNNGLEWAHRLYSEPRRLWMRYLISVPRFAVLALLEEVGRRLSVIAHRVG